MLSSSSMVHVYRQVSEIKGCLVLLKKYFPNGRCRLSSCLLAVLAMSLANSSPILSSETSDLG